MGVQSEDEVSICELKEHSDSLLIQGKSIEEKDLRETKLMRRQKIFHSFSTSFDVRKQKINEKKVKYTEIEKVSGLERRRGRYEEKKK